MRHQVRDKMTGRYTVDTSNTPLSDAPTKFDRMTEFPVQAQGADPRDLAYDMEPRNPDAGMMSRDDRPEGSPRSPLRPRTQRLIQSHVDASEVYATPDRATLHADAMREAAGQRAGDMDPVRYLVGDIDGIQE